MILRNYFDFTGGIVIPKQNAHKQYKEFPYNTAKTISSLSNENNEICFFRSAKYFLNVSHNDDIESIRSVLPEHANEMIEQIDILSKSGYPSGLEAKLMVLSLLDHKKHYSMCILNSFFNHMLKGQLDLPVYESAQNCCIKDISNYYNFLLTGNLSEQGRILHNVIKSFQQEITLPKPSPPTLDKPDGETTASKLILREMDHPIQILLFAGQLLDQDKKGNIEVVVNPLYGAMEIGYALKAIYGILGIEKVNNVFMIRYSHYGQDDCCKKSLEPFVPKQLCHCLDGLKEKRILVIDDNVFTGVSLRDVKQMCKEYSHNVGISAIERKTEDKSLYRVLEYDDLDIKPISKLRYINNIIEHIENINLSGIYK